MSVAVFPSETGPSETGPSETGPSETGPSETGPSETGPSETVLARATLTKALAPVRVDGGIAVAFKADQGTTRIATLAEHGGYRLKFPDSVGDALEGVVVNTGGGVVGGDRVTFSVSAGAGAQAAITTATAERIYRSTGAASELDVKLAAASGATLAWLPQATILFSQSRLKRRFEVDLAPDARLLMTEATIFGREASGEVMGEGLLQDVWRVRRGGDFVFAEATRLDGNLTELLARPAIAASVRGVALLLCVAPDIEETRDAVRAAIAGCDVLAGVSAWNGMLVMRAQAKRLDALQLSLRRAIDALQIAHPPQAWSA
jgi:urease accessory protein